MADADENAPMFVPPNRFQVDEPHRALDMSTIEMNPASMEKIEVFPDDIVRVKGKMRRACCAVVRENPDVPEGVVSMDQVLRFNLRLRTSDFCTIKSIGHVRLRSVTVALIDTPHSQGLEGDIKRIVVDPYFQRYPAPGRPVCVGDVFTVPFAMKPLQFCVTAVEAFDGTSDWGVVELHHPSELERTTVVYSPEPIPESEGLKGLGEVGYGDVGGLKRQLSQIREMIELPLRLPKLFSTIGVKPPKGVLLTGPPGCGKTMIAKAITNEVGAAYFVINGPDIIAPVAGQSEENLRKAFAHCEENSPAILFIDEIDAIAPDREKVHDEQMRRIVATLLTCMDGLKPMKQVMVLAATNRANSLDSALRRAGRFDSEIVIPVPDRAARLEILEIMTIKKGMKLKPFNKKLEEEHPGHPDNKDGVDLDHLADITHGFVGADLAALCTKAALATVRQRASALVDLHEADVPVEYIDQLYVLMPDFINALKTITPSGMRDVAVSRPNTRFADIGGLERVKQELREMIEMPVKHASLFEEMGITPPKGALLYGPPGCGKTLIAKAIANECECNFISIKGPQLLSKWFGESESNVRDIFEKARQASPCVIFFDELDSVATRRGRGEGGGPGDSVVNQLLTEMDGVGPRKNVFVIGATNFLDSVDPAVLRPGRLDQFIYIGLPEGPEGCLNVLRANLRKTLLHPSVNIQAIAEWCARSNLTGADIAGLCKRAIKTSVARRIAAEKAGTVTDGWAVTSDCFEDAAKETSPSVSAADRDRFETTRRRYQTQLTTDVTSSEWTGRFRIAAGDARLARQEFGTIDKVEEAVEAEGERHGGRRHRAAAGGAGEGKDDA